MTDITRPAELSQANTPTTEAGRVHVGRFKPKNDSQKLAYELVISDTIAIEAQAFMRGMDRANALNESKARDLLAATEDAAANAALKDVTVSEMNALLTTEEAESAGEGFVPWDDTVEGIPVNALGTRATAADATPTTGETDQ